MDPKTTQNWPKVLMVDDDPDLLELGVECLSNAGFPVLTASDGHRACVTLSSEPDIKLVVSDINMPNLDGITLLSYIKNNRPDVAVVLTSGYAKQSEKELILLGAIAFFSKPYSPTTLADFVRLHFRKNDELAQAPIVAPPSKLTRTIFVLEDEPLDQKLLGDAIAHLTNNKGVNLDFFSDANSFLDGLRNGSVPDLIVLDINLKGLSGLDAFKIALNEGLVTAEFPKVLVLTSSRLNTDFEKAHKLGIKSLYSKPSSRIEWQHLARAIFQSWIQK